VTELLLVLFMAIPVFMVGVLTEHCLLLTISGVVAVIVSFTTSTWPTEVLDLIGITAAYLAGVLYINRSKAAHKKLLAHLTAQRNSQR
jgi:nicotinamide riboside transporter PnuC